MLMLHSPLEQFQILPLVPIHFLGLDISLTQSVVLCVLCLGIFLFGQHLAMSPAYVVPGPWQSIFETMYTGILAMVQDNLGKTGQAYFPFVLVLFSFVMVCNVGGLVPYSFTVTSHLIVTFALALMVFGAVITLSVQKHGLHMLSSFLPKGTSLPLALLLVPIELVSYIFKPVSLAVRLFANMMAGHTLLKVIGGFAWAMMGSGSVLLVAHLLPVGVLVLLVGLELGVALIQAYVFTILTCIYLHDGLYLH